MAKYSLSTNLKEPYVLKEFRNRVRNYVSDVEFINTQDAMDLYRINMEIYLAYAKAYDGTSFEKNNDMYNYKDEYNDILVNNERFSISGLGIDVSNLPYPDLDTGLLTYKRDGKSNSFNRFSTSHMEILHETHRELYSFFKQKHKACSDLNAFKDFIFRLPHPYYITLLYNNPVAQNLLSRDGRYYDVKSGQFIPSSLKESLDAYGDLYIENKLNEINELFTKYEEFENNMNKEFEKLNKSIKESVDDLKDTNSWLSYMNLYIAAKSDEEKNYIINNYPRKTREIVSNDTLLHGTFYPNNAGRYCLTKEELKVELENHKQSITQVIEKELNDIKNRVKSHIDMDLVEFLFNSGSIMVNTQIFRDIYHELLSDSFVTKNGFKLFRMGSYSVTEGPIPLLIDKTGNINEEGRYDILKRAKFVYRMMEEYKQISILTSEASEADNDKEVEYFKARQNNNTQPGNPPPQNPPPNNGTDPGTGNNGGINPGNGNTGGGGNTSNPQQPPSSGSNGGGNTQPPSSGNTGGGQTNPPSNGSGGQTNPPNSGGNSGGSGNYTPTPPSQIPQVGNVVGEHPYNPYEDDTDISKIPPEKKGLLYYHRWKRSNYVECVDLSGGFK